MQGAPKKENRDEASRRYLNHSWFSSADLRKRFKREEPGDGGGELEFNL
jgi:hypothetical protein